MSSLKGKTNITYDHTKSEDNITERIQFDESVTNTEKKTTNNVTIYLIFSTFILNFAYSHLYGFQLGSLSSISFFVKDFINTTYIIRGRGVSSLTVDAIRWYWQFTYSILFAGGVIGTITVAPLLQRFSRKKSIFINLFVTALATLLQAMCFHVHSPEVLLIGRFVSGIAAGQAMVIGPMYLGEIAPTSIRGIIVGTTQISVSLGLFMPMILGFPEIFGKSGSWVFVLWYPFIPAITVAASLIFLPESPKYLLNKGFDAAAEKVLRKLRGCTDITEEVSSIRKELYADSALISMDKQKTGIRLIFHPDNRLSLLITLAITSTLQTAGINTIYAYANTIFTTAGIHSASVSYALMGLGLASFISATAAIPIIERAGRRKLYLTSIFITIVCLILCCVFVELVLAGVEGKQTLSIFLIIWIVIITLFFNMGIATVAVVIPVEIFGQNTRSLGVSLGQMSTFAVGFIVSIAFESILVKAGGYSFLIFATLLLSCAIFLFFAMPETKGLSYDTIEGKLSERKKALHMS